LQQCKFDLEHKPRSELRRFTPQLASGLYELTGGFGFAQPEYILAERSRSLHQIIRGARQSRAPLIINMLQIAERYFYLTKIKFNGFQASSINESL